MQSFHQKSLLLRTAVQRDPSSLIRAFGLFLVTSALISGATLWRDYERQTAHYRAIQADEIAGVQKRQAGVLSALKSFVGRIARSLMQKGYQSLSDQRIQDIFYIQRARHDGALPFVQSIAYDQCKPPYRHVDRLAAHHAPTASTVCLEVLSERQAEPPILIDIQANHMVGRAGVFDAADRHVGWVTATITAEAFEQFLGSLTTLTKIPHQDPAILTFPCSLYPISPDSFLRYATTHTLYAKLFGVHLLMGLLLFGGPLVRVRQQFYRRLRPYVEARKQVIVQQQDYARLYTAYTAEHTLLKKKIQRTRQGLTQSVQALELAYAGVQADILEKEELAKLLERSLSYVTILQTGAVSATTCQSVNLNRILKPLGAFFGPYLQQAQLKFDVQSPDDPAPICHADPLIIELLVTGLVGQALYRAANNSCVTATVSHDGNKLDLHLQFQGYEEHPGLSQQPWHLSDAAIEKLCQKQQIHHTKTSTPTLPSNCALGLTFLQLSEQDAPVTNVVRLFP